MEEDATQAAVHSCLRRQKVAGEGEGEAQAGDVGTPVVLARLIQLSCMRDYMCRFGEASEAEAAMAAEAM